MTSTSPTGHWTLEEGATEAPGLLAPDKVGAGQGLVQPPHVCGEDRWSQHRGSVGRWVLQGLIPRLGEKFSSGPGGFEKSYLPSLVLTSDKKGSQQEELSCLFWVCLLESGRQTGMCVFP